MRGTRDIDIRVRESIKAYRTWKSEKTADARREREALVKARSKRDTSE